MLKRLYTMYVVKLIAMKARNVFMGDLIVESG